MITKEDIRKALNVIDDINVDYGKKDAEGIKEIDDALDLIQIAAQKYMHLGADKYGKELLLKRVNGAAHEIDEAYKEGYQDGLKDGGAEKTRGTWEPMDNDGEPLIMPMLVCSECQKTNFYPGRFCTYCGSDNSGED